MSTVCAQKSAPPCVYATPMRRYVLIANIYKAAECISLAHHVSLNSATNSAKAEQEVIPL